MLKLTHTHHAAPSVVRGVPCTFGTGTCAGEVVLAYGSGHQAVLRSVADPNKVLKTYAHALKVTAVRMSPCGRLCASADEGGNVRVWSADPSSTASAKEFQPLSAPVRDLSWSHDSERLVVVGEGRSTRGIVINAQLGTTMGDLGGVTGDMSSCDFRKDRPFRIAVGTADSMTGFYEGPPFKFVCSVKDQHKAKVTCVRYAPDNSVFASVSGAPQVLLQDGKTGEVVRKIETGHTGTIYAVAWSADGKQIATASADKSVRCFAVVDGAPIFSTTVGAAVRDMQLGLASVPGGWVALNMSGDLSFIGADGGITRTVRGFDKSVKVIRAMDDGSVLAVNFEGRALSFQLAGDAIGFAGKEPAFVEGGAATEHGLTLWTGERAINANVAGSTLEPSLETKALCGAAVGAGGFAIGQGNALLLMRDGKEVAKTPLPKKALAVAVAGATVVVVTEPAAHVFVAQQAALSPVTTIEGAGTHRSDMCTVAISQDGTRIATGDTTNVIAVWDAATGAAVHTGLSHHGSRVNCLAFAPNSTNVLCSGGNDNAIILWNLEGQSRHKQDNAHAGPVTAITFSSDGSSLISAGYDGCVKRWSTA